MTGAVLADTGPLYALADPSDQYHPQAVAELKGILAQNLRVAVHYPVLCESHTLILRRLGGVYSRQWLSEVLNGSVLLNPDPTDYLAAAALLEHFADQAITLIDAVTAVLTQRLAIAVWSYDRHFTIMGVRRWRALSSGPPRR